MDSLSLFNLSMQQSLILFPLPQGQSQWPLGGEYFSALRTLTTLSLSGSHSSNLAYSANLPGSPWSCSPNGNFPCCSWLTWLRKKLRRGSSKKSAIVASGFCANQDSQTSMQQVSSSTLIWCSTDRGILPLTSRTMGSVSGKPLRISTSISNLSKHPWSRLLPALG